MLRENRISFLRRIDTDLMIGYFYETTLKNKTFRTRNQRNFEINLKIKKELILFPLSILGVLNRGPIKTH